MWCRDEDQFQNSMKWIFAPRKNEEGTHDKIMKKKNLKIKSNKYSKKSKKIKSSPNGTKNLFKFENSTQNVFRTIFVFFELVQNLEPDFSIIILFFPISFKFMISVLFSLFLHHFCCVSQQFCCFCN